MTLGPVAAAFVHIAMQSVGFLPVALNVRETLFDRRVKMPRTFWYLVLLLLLGSTVCINVARAEIIMDSTAERRNEYAFGFLFIFALLSNIALVIWASSAAKRRISGANATKTKRFLETHGTITSTSVMGIAVLFMGAELLCNGWLVFHERVFANWLYFFLSLPYVCAGLIALFKDAADFKSIRDGKYDNIY